MAELNVEPWLCGTPIKVSAVHRGVLHALRHVGQAITTAKVLLAQHAAEPF